MPSNSNGWTIGYQLYRTDCATACSTFICDCAGVKTTSKGIICAIARLTNEDTAWCIADQVWVMHDVYIDWQGRITKICEEEYDYQEMVNRFGSGPDKDPYIKGFADLSDFPLEWSSVSCYPDEYVPGIEG